MLITYERLSILVGLQAISYEYLPLHYVLRTEKTKIDREVVATNLNVLILLIATQRISVLTGLQSTSNKKSEF